MNTEDRIKGYVDRIEDIAYLECVLDEVPLPDLFQSLLKLLASSEYDDVARTDFFIRDVICRAKTNNGAFKKQLIEAGIPTAYEQNVFAQNFQIRRLAIGALRISCDWWSSTGLLDVLTFLETNDPILLPDALGVQMQRMQWKDWSWPNRLIGNPDFLVRWSVLGLLNECCVHFPLPESGILTETKSCLSKLQNDENAFVKIEADFLSATVSYYEIMSTLEKPEKRRRSKAMDKSSPKTRFSDLSLRVGNELISRQKTDFSMKELHEILSRLAEA